MADTYFGDSVGRLYFFGPRIARGCAADNDRRSVGLDELHHAANVVAVRHFLLVRAVSPGAATVYSSPPADRSQQRAAVSNERRRVAVVQLDSDQYSACVVPCQFRCRAEDL